MKWLLTYLAGLLTFLVVDGVWLGLVARSFYAERLGFLLADSINFVAAGAFYILYVAACLVLVVRPAAAIGSLWNATLMGATLGATAYATYDLTNLATVQGWPLEVAIVDIVWGAILTAAVCSVSYVVHRR